MATSEVETSQLVTRRDKFICLLGIQVFHCRMSDGRLLFAIKLELCCRRLGGAKVGRFHSRFGWMTRVVLDANKFY